MKPVEKMFEEIECDEMFNEHEALMDMRLDNLHEENAFRVNAPSDDHLFEDFENLVDNS